MCRAGMPIEWIQSILQNTNARRLGADVLVQACESLMSVLQATPSAELPAVADADTAAGLNSILSWSLDNAKTKAPKSTKSTAGRSSSTGVPRTKAIRLAVSCLGALAEAMRCPGEGTPKALLDCSVQVGRALKSRSRAIRRAAVRAIGSEQSHTVAGAPRTLWHDRLRSVIAGAGVRKKFDAVIHTMLAVACIKVRATAARAAGAMANIAGYPCAPEDNSRSVSPKMFRSDKQNQIVQRLVELTVGEDISSQDQDEAMRALSRMTDGVKPLRLWLWESGHYKNEVVPAMTAHSPAMRQHARSIVRTIFEARRLSYSYFVSTPGAIEGLVEGMWPTQDATSQWCAECLLKIIDARPQYDTVERLSSCGAIERLIDSIRPGAHCNPDRALIATTLQRLDKCCHQSSKQAPSPMKLALEQSDLLRVAAEIGFVREPEACFGEDAALRARAVVCNLCYRDSGWRARNDLVASGSLEAVARGASTDLRFYDINAYFCLSYVCRWDESFTSRRPALLAAGALDALVDQVLSHYENNKQGLKWLRAISGLTGFARTDEGLLLERARANPRTIVCLLAGLQLETRLNDVTCDSREASATVLASICRAERRTLADQQRLLPTASPGGAPADAGGSAGHRPVRDSAMDGGAPEKAVCRLIKYTDYIQAQPYVELLAELLHGLEIDDIRAHCRIDQADEWSSLAKRLTTQLWEGKRRFADVMGMSLYLFGKVCQVHDSVEQLLVPEWMTFVDAALIAPTPISSLALGVLDHILRSGGTGSALVCSKETMEFVLKAWDAAGSGGAMDLSIETEAMLEELGAFGDAPTVLKRVAETGPVQIAELRAAGIEATLAARIIQGRDAEAAVSVLAACMGPAGAGDGPAAGLLDGLLADTSSGSGSTAGARGHRAVELLDGLCRVLRRGSSQAMREAASAIQRLGPGLLDAAHEGRVAMGSAAAGAPVAGAAADGSQAAPQSAQPEAVPSQSEGGSGPGAAPSQSEGGSGPGAALASPLEPVAANGCRDVPGTPGALCSAILPLDGRIHSAAARRESKAEGESEAMGGGAAGGGGGALRDGAAPSAHKDGRAANKVSLVPRVVRESSLQALEWAEYSGLKGTEGLRAVLARVESTVDLAGI